MPGSEEIKDNAIPEQVRQSLRAKVLLATELAIAAKGHESAAFERLLSHLLQQSSSTEIGRNPRDDPKPAKRTRSSAGGRAPTSPDAAPERIKPFMESDSELVSKVALWIMPLNVRHRIYGILRVARDQFDIDGLSLVEIRAIGQKKLRLGIPDPSLRSSLSTAPVSELGKERGTDGKTIYRLMHPGEAALDEAIKKSTVGKSDQKSEQ